MPTSASTIRAKYSRGSAILLKINLMKSIVSLPAPASYQLPAPTYRLEWTADPAVLTHAPEVHRHQHRDAERQTDAVQHVEPQQRAFADERPAQQRESRVVGRMDQLDVAERQERGARTLVTEERCRARHVRADRDSPDGELIPRQQVPGE